MSGPDLPAITVIVEWTKQLGSFGAVVFILFASYKGWWAWGWEFKKLEKDRDEWKTLALRLGGVADRALQKL